MAGDDGHPRAVPARRRRPLVSALRLLVARLAGLFHGGRRDRELAAELEVHLAMQIEDNVRAGMTPEAARRDALLRAGGVLSATEAYRDQRGLPWIEALGQDARYALRMIRKAPGFAAVIILTLALGIGANTAIFSVVHAALTPLAVPEPDRVVMVWTDNLKRDWHEFPASAADYVDWRASGIFSSLGAFHDAGCNLRVGDADGPGRRAAGHLGALRRDGDEGRGGAAARRRRHAPRARSGRRHQRPIVAVALRRGSVDRRGDGRRGRRAAHARRRAAAAISAPRPGGSLRPDGPDAGGDRRSRFTVARRPRPPVAGRQPRRRRSSGSTGSPPTRPASTPTMRGTRCGCSGRETRTSRTPARC